MEVERRPNGMFLGSIKVASASQACGLGTAVVTDLLVEAHA